MYAEKTYQHVGGRCSPRTACPFREHCYPPSNRYKDFQSLLTQVGFELTGKGFILKSLPKPSISLSLSRALKQEPVQLLAIYVWGAKHKKGDWNSVTQFIPRMPSVKNA